jgi:hypothetical protein
MKTPTIRRNLDEALREAARPTELEKERGFYQRPQVPEKGNTSTWCGSSYSGEKFSGRNLTGGRGR